MNVVKNNSCLSCIVKVFLYINAAVMLLIILSNTLLCTKRRIHPDYNYAISKSREFDSYYLTSTEGDLQPSWFSYIGLQGIYLEGEKLYIQYHEDEFYLIHLAKVEREKLEKLPIHIKLVNPEIFWRNLKK